MAKYRNPFDAPIPGESLTKAPGSQKWEKPPQFTDPEKALEFVWDNMMKPKNMEKLLALMDAGVPVEAIARTTLFAGFAEGKWTPALVTLMARPVTSMVAHVAKAAGKGNLKMQAVDRRKQQNTELAKIMSLKERRQYENEQKKPKDSGNSIIPEGFGTRRA